LGQTPKLFGTNLRVWNLLSRISLVQKPGFSGKSSDSLRGPSEPVSDQLKLLKIKSARVTKNYNFAEMMLQNEMVLGFDLYLEKAALLAELDRVSPPLAYFSN